ncbi:MAG: type I restriction-modification enzyme R subunit C-terminal domain-containing protein, partial [Cyanobium sp.]
MELLQQPIELAAEQLVQPWPATALPAEQQGVVVEGFSAFVRDPGNDLPALTLVLTKPWELNRKDLRELRLALDQRGYSETTLATAWRETTNQDMAASIMGWIRQAALGDPLMPYEQRVEKALQRILASRSWSKPQRDWLQRIANQTKAITI